MTTHLRASYGIIYITGVKLFHEFVDSTDKINSNIIGNKFVVTSMRIRFEIHNFKCLW